jgi:hypothetical protein
LNKSFHPFIALYELWRMFQPAKKLARKAGVHFGRMYLANFAKRHSLPFLQFQEFFSFLFL